MAMTEANPFKFYLAKYFFLAFAMVQILVGGVILIRFEVTTRNLLVALAFFVLGLILIFIYFLVNDRIRRVAIGKNKIVVIEGNRNIRFSWPEVKSLKIIPFFNLYRLRIKGKHNTIYFFPSGSVDLTPGLPARDSSKIGGIVGKRKKEPGF